MKELQQGNEAWKRALQLREQGLVSSAGMLHQQAMLREQQLIAHQQHFVEWQKAKFAELEAAQKVQRLGKKPKMTEEEIHLAPPWPFLLGFLHPGPLHPLLSCPCFPGSRDLDLAVFQAPVLPHLLQALFQNLLPGDGVPVLALFQASLLSLAIFFALSFALLLCIIFIRTLMPPIFPPIPGLAP